MGESMCLAGLSIDRSVTHISNAHYSTANTMYESKNRLTMRLGACRSFLSTHARSPQTEKHALSVADADG